MKKGNAVAKITMYHTFGLRVITYHENLPINLLDTV